MHADGERLGQPGGLFGKGAIKPVVDRTLPFDQLNEAMALVESGRGRGKVVVKIR
ncbi:zinc-binding dehydrogenase [Rhizorhabdus dicambivorans]|uniref:zinc-binding dehydrogenase n=1 Tax=Rhizorhabdus dicambivorans TaxID=1850238 RepID=UPI0038B69910